MKGISPLIASVLLIAITAVTASLITVWARSLVTEQAGVVKSEIECVGALDLSEVKYDNGNLTLTIRNLGNIDIEGIRASVIYDDATKNTEYVLKDYGVAEPLSPGSTDWAVIPIGSPKPLRVELVSVTCPKHPSSLSVI